jgi:hypothetical protein
MAGWAFLFVHIPHVDRMANSGFVGGGQVGVREGRNFWSWTFAAGARCGPKEYLHVWLLF